MSNSTIGNAGKIAVVNAAASAGAIFGIFAGIAAIGAIAQKLESKKSK